MFSGVVLMFEGQDDISGVGGGELVRPLSRFEISRIVALAKQRVAGRMTSPSEWIALRKLQLQQVGVSELQNRSIDAIHFCGRRDDGHDEC